jgi:hypothetical protein
LVLAAPVATAVPDGTIRWALHGHHSARLVVKWVSIPAERQRPRIELHEHDPGV